MYRHFLDYIADEDIDTTDICTSKSRLLTFLGNEFGNLLTSFCVDKRVGTVFHRTKADMQTLLSYSLHVNSICEPTYQPVDVGFLNRKIHEVIKHQKRCSDPLMKLAIDVEGFVDTVRSLAPELWDHVTKLTQSVNERRGRSASVSEASFSGRIKHLRRAYLVSLILFITNSECNHPFHVVLSDIVESCGGSTELMTILNRFGIAASIETLKRTIHSVSEDRRSAGIKSLLVDKAFTVASADNVDFLQSNAAVYTGDQHCSWHGTSIQLVQPRPQSAVHSEQVVPRRRLFSSVGEVTSSESTNSSSMRDPPLPCLDYNPNKRLQRLLSRKRHERSSPVCSPSQSTRSPCNKRARTFAEALKYGGGQVAGSQGELFRQHIAAIASHSQVEIKSFQINSSETEAVDELNQVLFKYVLLKEACGSDNLLVDMKTFCGMTLPSIPKVECSNVVYLSVVDLHADTPEAMKKVVAKLHEEYMVGVNVNYLVLVGDQKTYVRINELKDEYGNALDWLIPFIGDWHLLSNYQSVLMKVYYDAGLKELAEASGHRGETLTSIKNSSSFKRTHQFLVQAWEAVYRQMFKSFNSCACDDDSLSISDILSAAKANMLACNQMSTDKTSSDLLKEFLERRKEIHSKLFKVFNSWVDKCADEDPNWKFWTKFVFRDMLSYLSLYVSMRGGLWKLRMGGIKTLAPLFAAFDRPHYQKLLPNHLRDLAKMPTDVISFFKSGSFVCSVTGGHMHSVALDEAHEMLINKDLKTTIVRPTKEYLDRMLYYYPVRSMLQKAVKK